MALDLEKFNTDWLKAWTDKDVPRLLGFYTEDCLFRDPQNAAGLKGHAALREYLSSLFAATPPMAYTADEIWATHDGYCGRWYCAIGNKGEGGRLRGFDLVVLKGDKIALNDVFIHQLPAA